MTRTMLIVWGAGVGMLGLQLLSIPLGLTAFAPLLALGIGALIVWGPMRVTEAPQTGWIFAFAGVFWLAVILLGLGTLDPLTRNDKPTWFHSEP